MKYTVTVEQVRDTRAGLVQRTIAVRPGLTKDKAITLAEGFAVDNENHVYIAWYRASDGQTGYLNRDGHGITGQRW